MNFVVVKIEYKDGNDDVCVFLNPPLGTEPLPTLARAGQADLSFDGISFGAYLGKTIYHDEIRVGTSYLDVTPYTGTPFSRWMMNYPTLGTQTNQTDNMDGDALDNLYEYALGGNPTNGNDTGISSAFHVLSNGTSNYLEYVYAQRNDDASLSYWLELNTNLLRDAWTREFYEVIGTNTASGIENFVSVTQSRTDRRNPAAVYPNAGYV